MVRYVENGDSLILSTLPRRTCFTRREPGPVPRDQAVAANFDYVFILQSVNQDFNPKRLERYLTLSWQSGATPVILLTKADLVEDCRAYLTRAERVCAGAEVHVVSAIREDDSRGRHTTTHRQLLRRKRQRSKDVAKFSRSRKKEVW